MLPACIELTKRYSSRHGKDKINNLTYSGLLHTPNLLCITQGGAWWCVVLAAGLRKRLSRVVPRSAKLTTCEYCLLDGCRRLSLCADPPKGLRPKLIRRLRFSPGWYLMHRINLTRILRIYSMSAFDSLYGVLLRARQRPFAWHCSSERSSHASPNGNLANRGCRSL